MYVRQEQSCGTSLVDNTNSSEVQSRQSWGIRNEALILKRVEGKCVKDTYKNDLMGLLFPPPKKIEGINFEKFGSHFCVQQ